jgi:uncharacterized repeat protein (TIGR01451 family)
MPESQNIGNQGSANQPLDPNHAFPENYTGSQGSYRPILAGTNPSPVANPAQTNPLNPNQTPNNGPYPDSVYQTDPNQLDQNPYVGTNPATPYDPNYSYPNHNYQPGSHSSNYPVGYDPNLDPNYLNQDPYFQVSGPEVQPAVNKDQSRAAKFGWNSITTFLLKYWFLILVAVLGLSVFGVGLYVFLKRPAGYTNQDFLNVTGRIDAPQTSPSGSPNRWSVVIQNKESVSLQDLVVELSFDRTFKYTKAINPDPSEPKGNVYKFAKLAGVGQGTSDILIQFEGVLSGNIDEEAVMSGTVSYTPTPLVGKEGNRRTISISAQKTRITAPEIRLEVSTPEQSVQNGGEATINVNFENLSERELKDIRVRVNYPDKGGFIYTSSILTLTTTGDTKTNPDDGNNTWYISTLPRLKQQNLQIKGKVFGAEGIRQTFVAEISIRRDGNDFQTLVTSSKDILITSQPLIITTQIQNKDNQKFFSPGETLTFEVEYQNKGTVTLQNVEILAFIDDPANILDYTTINLVGGDFQGNINNRVIHWRSSGSTQLATVTPQTKGKFLYSIRVKDNPQFIQSALNQSAYTLRPKAQGKALNVQQVEFAGDLYKATGDLIFEQTVSQPKKDKNQQNKATYTITWTLKTRQNKVNDVVIITTSPLPTTSWQQASISPASNADKLNYDPALGTITWRPGNLESYTGISRGVVSISFDLVVVAPEGQTTSNQILFGPTKISGVDDFTGIKYDKSTADTITAE